MVEKIPTEKIGIKWQSPEFIFHEKNFGWFSKFSLIALVLIVFFIYLGISQKHTSYYLAAGVVLAAITALFSQARAKPQSADFHLDQDGIEISGRKYFWHNLRNFWISDDTIYFENKKRISFPVSAPLGDQNSTELRNYLLQYLPEKSDGGEMVFDKINKIFKF